MADFLTATFEVIQRITGISKNLLEVSKNKNPREYLKYKIESEWSEYLWTINVTKELRKIIVCIGLI